MAWSTSDRRERLPKNWNTIRKIKLHEANWKCQAKQHHPRCDKTGTEVDHIIPGDDHSFENLQVLSKECHKAKTARETAARNKARSTKRAQEKHPGLLV